VINFAHPANCRLLAYFQSRNERGHESELDPATVDNPYYTLGTHPEIVERLWDDLGSTLPMRCRWVMYGRPVLVHPSSGVVFGYAGGTLTYALRLPPIERAAAVKAGAKTIHEYPAYAGLDVAASRLDLGDDFGPEWVFGGWLGGEEAWCRAAFDYAGKDV
jgi:hypothetical protein